MSPLSPPPLNIYEAHEIKKVGEGELGFVCYEITGFLKIFY